MSKINAIRLINLNYNHNAIRISDEVFHLNGESTLFSLRNGGGKSVLVQMLTAPFVHKRYRDTRDRLFRSYFTTNKPTFILVEWKLDGGAGYVLTGMMVRKSQEISEENAVAADELEMINFISEYRERCMQDIFHLPVVEKNKKEIVLKSFGACRQLFEQYRKDRSMRFYCYDMGNASQARQYFERLEEYQIFYREWETIIKKVNLKESGLSDLFADCRDEKGLTEKWFLEAVESKLNKERNRMKEFQNIVGKYVRQYRDNQSKIQRRDTIRRFEEQVGGIQQIALVRREKEENVQALESRIAAFYARMGELQEEYNRKQACAVEETKELKQRISKVVYEKLSAEIYGLWEEEKLHQGNRAMIEMERESVMRQLQETERLLHLLACAKQQELVDEEQREFAHIRESLAVAKQREQDLEPERRLLGRKLLSHYERELGETEDGLLQNRENIAQERARLAEEKEQQRRLGEDYIRIREQIKKKETEISFFDRQESHFNQRYDEKLARNILGEYEAGSLEILKSAYEKECTEKKRVLVQMKKETEAAKERRRALIRGQEETVVRLSDCRHALLEQQKKKEALEEETRVRKTILRYLDLPETDLYQREKIERASERKLEETDRDRSTLEKEYNEVHGEYIRLTQGKVLELPEEFQELLDGLGVHYVYGMEWLKKNGNSEVENTALVRNCPFLPYALILSRVEMEKLAACGEKVYTSVPIPLLLREELTGASEAGHSPVVAMAGVHFYVVFNENLLDEEALKEMLAGKERRMERLKNAIAQKKKEYDEYFARLETVRGQILEEAVFQENEKAISRTQQELSGLEHEGKRLAEELAALETEVSRLSDRIAEAGQEQEYLARRQEDFLALCAQYEKYGEQRTELMRCRREAERIQERQRLKQEQQEKLEQRLETLRNQELGLLERKKMLTEKRSGYLEFENEQTVSGEAAAVCMKPEELTEAEARYQAITQSFSAERRELEERMTATGKRLERARADLSHLSNKYQLSEGAWTGTVYSRSEEQHQELLLAGFLEKKQEKDALWNREDKELARLAEQLKWKMQQMRNECGESEPLQQELIVTEDFEGKLRQYEYMLGEKKRETEELEKRASMYASVLTALAEFSELTQREEETFEEDFSEMERSGLDAFCGRLVRDYRIGVEERRAAGDKLAKEINQMLRVESFSEDFYRKPLEVLLELAPDAQPVLAQLETTLQSYRSLMEKLEVDISFIWQERDNMIELLFDYLHEVHDNLGQIDRSSTITIREKPVKMLKLILPDWEENEGIYRMRLKDYLEELTQKAIEIFERNENAEEYFGMRITTKSLYDTVVGIGNVQIRLYKIEEYREYAITWAEVAKNSGGEGFLSAFVILTSLLYYMRRDESDIFADRNEGKVLLMDNPFAQTNAAHLLKPLMDMAKKTNTQLICLSGLGGESIYSRFDNIYVLNLIAASLRSGMQYLKADHLRGDDVETMIASQIEVVQQQLIF